jgi:hypothetical protein
VLAHGRDPYFDGWPDTLQLDYWNPETLLDEPAFHAAAFSMAPEA